MSCVHPGMILGSSEYPRNPRILRQGGVELCPSRDDPRIVRVSQESRDTQTRGVELCPSRDDPRIVQVSQESRDTQTRGVELCPSRDDPRTVRVSQESQDTQTRGVELFPSRDDPRTVPSIAGIPGYLDRGGVSCVHPGMIPGPSEYPRNPGILRQGE